MEKNIEAFLQTGVRGSKVVVGDGPALSALARRFPETRFLGALHGAALASAYASADVLVFPRPYRYVRAGDDRGTGERRAGRSLSRAGSLDIIGLRTEGGRIGALHDDLTTAIRLALTADPNACVTAALAYDWERCVDQFLSGLRPVNGVARAAAGAPAGDGERPAARPAATGRPRQNTAPPPALDQRRRSAARISAQRTILKFCMPFVLIKGSFHVVT